MERHRGELVRLCRTLAQAADFGQALAEFIETANRSVRGNEAGLLMLARDGRILRELCRTGRKPRQPLVLRVGPEGVSGWVAKFGRAAITPDNARDSRYVRTDKKYKSMIAIPVRQGKRLVGVLACESARRAAFGTPQLRILEELEPIAEIAVRLYEAQERDRRGAQRLGMLNHLTRAMTTLDPKAFVVRVADQVRRVLDVSFTGIRVADFDREEVVLVSQSADGPGSPVPRLKFGQGINGKAFKLGEIVNARDVKRDPFYVEGVTGVASELSVPVRRGDYCVGILDLQSREPCAFDSDDVMLVETVARFLAPALARLAETKI